MADPLVDLFMRGIGIPEKSDFKIRLCNEFT